MAEAPLGRPLYVARDVCFTYPGADRPAVDGVSLEVPPGTLYGVLGPNGSGKSTLLKLLLGSLRPDDGRVAYGGRGPSEWGRRSLARRVGVVPQHEEVAFPVTVRELVAMGRYPHLGPWRAERDEDRRAVGRALRRCDLAGLEERPISTLSGGERQLARVARALAQEPEVLVLDEPTVSLDIRHEMEIFGLLRRLVDEEGVTVLLVTHNLNAAARTARRLLLLDDGRRAAEGPPEEVLTRATVEDVYGWPVRVARHPGPGPDTGAPQVVPLTSADAADHGGSPGGPDVAPDPRPDTDEPTNPRKEPSDP